MRTSSWAVAAALCMLFAVPDQAQAQRRRQKTQEELKAMRDKKLAKEVFQKAPWIFNLEEAKAEAKKSGQLIFAYFTRSYSP